MMLPAVTSWPPYTLTPRYFGFESRPLRLEPTPFLCAMTQCSGCSGVDARDLDFGEVLPMTLLLLVVLAAAELDDADLVGAAVLAHGGGHGGAGHGRRTDGDRLAFADQQHLVELHGGAFFGVQQLHAQDIALLHAILLATGLDDCVTHGIIPSVVILLGSVTAFRAGRTADCSQSPALWSIPDQTLERPPPQAISNLPGLV